MGQKKGGSVSKRNKERCGEAPGSGNALGPSLFILSLSLSFKRRETLI